MKYSESEMKRMICILLILLTILSSVLVVLYTSELISREVTAGIMGITGIVLFSLMLWLTVRKCRSLQQKEKTPK